MRDLSEIDSQESNGDQTVEQTQPQHKSEITVFVTGEKDKKKRDTGTSKTKTGAERRKSTRSSLKGRSSRRISLGAVKSVLKSLSPKKERDEDVFFSPYDSESEGPYELPSEINDLRDEPTDTNDTVDERSRSVSIGGHTVIQDDWSTSNVALHTFVFGSDGSDQDAKVPSVVLQEGRRTNSANSDFLRRLLHREWFCMSWWHPCFSK
jgi:hypothetical protein